MVSSGARVGVLESRAMRSPFDKQHARVLNKRIVLSVGIVLCLSGAFAQTASDTGADKVYKVGEGASAPVLIYSPDPEYSKEARKAKRGDTCVLNLVVDTNGRTRDIKIIQSVGVGLDEKAIEAVKQWKFKPAMKDGRPVIVEIRVEIDFRRYNGSPPESRAPRAPPEASFDDSPHFTPEQAAKLDAEWNTKPSYTQEQLADLWRKCVAYADKSFADLQDKRVALPPHECAGILGWMRTLDVESLYVAAKPQQH